MKTICVMQLKGGAGRSTISTNLAGILGRTHKTLLIDCDQPQGTSDCWYAIRQEKHPDKVKNLQNASANTVNDLENLHKYADQDYVIIDAPPRLEKQNKSAVMLADLIIIPCAPTLPDLWATHDFLELLNEAEKTAEARIAWNKYRPYTRSARELKEDSEKDLPIEKLKSYLGYRVAYSDAVSEGLTADEVRDTNASLEIISMVNEIKKTVGK